MSIAFSSGSGWLGKKHSGVTELCWAQWDHSPDTSLDRSVLAKGAEEMGREGADMWTVAALEWICVLTRGVMFFLKRLFIYLSLLIRSHATRRDKYPQWETLVLKVLMEKRPFSYHTETWFNCFGMSLLHLFFLAFRQKRRKGKNSSFWVKQTFRWICSAHTSFSCNKHK